MNDAARAIPEARGPAGSATADLAGTALVRQYGRLIASVVGRVGGRMVEEIRDDLEQEVRIALWRRWDRGREIEHPTSYVYRAAVRATVHAVRRRQGRRELSLTDRDVPGGQDPAAALEAKRVRQHVESSLAALLPHRAQAVRAHLAGEPVADIMKREGWSYQKARNLIARGMADLRESLRAKGLEY